MTDGSSDRRGPYRGPSRSAPYALSRLSGPVSLVDVAKEIEQADHLIVSTTNAQLELIAEQMRALREKAHEVLEKARVNAELHRVDARFKRHPGKVYHLYQRDDGSRYWSLLSPAEWGIPPHGFLGSFRLELDQSFTDVTDAREDDGTAESGAQWLRRRLLGDGIP